MRTFVLLLLVLLIGCPSAGAQSRKKGRSVSIRKEKKQPSKPAEPDSVILNPFNTELISISGYNKPLRSSFESFLITNSSDSLALDSLTVEITYLDLKGRQVHRRRVGLPVEVPPGQTIKADFPSWDRQKSWFYRRGVRPSVDRAMPYDVSVTVLDAFSP